MELTYENAVDFLIEAIKADYLDYTLRSGGIAGCEVDFEGLSAVNHRMIEDFNSSFTVKHGRKYTKIIKDGGVWGFVVATDDDVKFPKGTILMAAGWAAPARNHSRGNILTGNYQIQWTGPLYM